MIYGAGAIGGVLGAGLHESGHDVVLVARGENFEILSRDGLRIEDWRGARYLKIPVVRNIDDTHIQGRNALIVLAVKSQDSRDALSAIRSVRASGVSILCAQNGVENEREALRYFPIVYGSVVSCYATYLRPGIVQAHSAPVYGSIDLGRYPQGGDDVAEDIARCLRASSFDSSVQVNIMPWKWRKLLVNVGSAVEAICGSTATGGLLVTRARKEAENVLAAAGVMLPAEDEVAARGYAKTHVAIPREGGSSWQSLRRRTGRVESDFINGEIVLLGRLYGVPTPVNELLQRISCSMALEKVLAGSFREADLLAALG